MIKTIDTSVVTPEMESAMKGVFVKTIHKMAMAFGQPLPSTEEIDAAWIDSIGGCTEYYKAALEAAPEVKTQPIGTLILGGIVGNEYDEIDIDLKSKALEALQEELVSSENPVVLKVYAHPPAVSADVVERIRALLKVIPEYASVNGHQLIYDIIRRIEWAK